MFFQGWLKSFFKFFLILNLILAGNTSIFLSGVKAEEAKTVNTTNDLPANVPGNESAEDMQILELEKKLNELKEKRKKEQDTKDNGVQSKDKIEDSAPKNLKTDTEKEKTEEPKEENIYPWLPSMSNIFSGKISQETKDLKPFGYELFNQGSTVFAPNTDVTVGSDYILGPGDNLQINIWGGTNVNLNVTVDREGKIILPEVGTFYVTGKSFGTIKEQIRHKLAEIFTDVQVDVSMGKLRKIKVYVVGEAKNPGAYDITSVTTLYNVLFMAGGPTNIGSLRNIDIIRNNKVIRKVDLYNFILRGDKSGDVRLENGDTVYFNLKGKTVGVQGLVNRPAIYEIKNENKLTDVINLAGGAVPTSYLKNVQVKRTEANKENVILNVDMTSKSKIDQLNIKDKDIINIFPILSVANKTIYLNGHVFRPGTYEYRNKMKLSEVIKSYSDLLPEPYLDYARIIRLQQPDLKPVSINFNLGDVLSKKTDLELKPFDSIVIYSKWDFTRIPEIEVSGEIFKPGKYKIFPGTRLQDIISMAGGLTKDTYTDRVELIRRADTYGNKQSISLNLKNALKGDPKENIEIKDEDLIIFHKNKDIIADQSVSIAGEVTKPDTYPLGKGMRIRDLINLGGSLTKAAYIKDAELIRYNMNGIDVRFTTMIIDLQRALAGDPVHNIPLQDMDRLLIKQVPHWKDIGMTIELNGQVKYPGSYAASPEDRLSDVIERAGGYLDDAYLKGAVFYRQSVKEIQRARLQKLISDIDESIALDARLSPDTLKNMAPEALLARERKIVFRKQLLDRLNSSDVTGRMVIDLTSLEKFKKSEHNVKISQGDVLFIPKRPDFISVLGEVFNQTAIVYKPNKTMDFYMEQAGGATPDADKSRLYIIKANGSIIAGEGKWFYDIRNEILEPGDTILVPQIVERADYLEAIRSIVDIAYKTATAAGVIITTTKAISGN